MYEFFENLEIDKKNKIINAAYNVFAKFGYVKASINDIAIEANISKSSLFHYFETKENLYLYLYDYALEKVTLNIPEGTSDLFECVALAARLKIKIFKEYPSMLLFLKSTLSESGELNEKLRTRNLDITRDTNNLLFKNVYWQQYEGFNREEIMNLLTWVSEGCIRSNMNLSLEETMLEIDKYLNYVKQIICGVRK